MVTEAYKVADGHKTVGEAIVDGGADIAAGSASCVASGVGRANPLLGVGTYVACKESGSGLLSKMGHAVLEKVDAFVDGVRQLPSDLRELVEFQLNAKGETLSEWGGSRPIVEEEE